MLDKVFGKVLYFRTGKRPCNGTASVPMLGADFLLYLFRFLLSNMHRSLIGHESETAFPNVFQK